MLKYVNIIFLLDWFIEATTQTDTYGIETPAKVERTSQRLTPRGENKKDIKYKRE